MTNKRIRNVVVAAMMSCAVVVVAACSSAAPSATSPSGSTAPVSRSNGAPNARSGPAEGGATGTASATSASGFTLTTSGGQKITVKATSGKVTDGESVLVLGMVDGTTITASRVVEHPATSTSGAAAVVPFQKGSPSTSKQVGQVPADYQEGEGTIVSGATADQAAEAALTSYPGGVVDRVVRLADGEYEVHNIGVNWPHHVFVTQSFTVAGAS
ncbi:MAG TPA: hypothetical protein VG674_33660 [Amycolatopsis sp.]|jgi:hypothetical protein|nr:hypothetical protein [Amycolatopsis sp.]